MYYRFFCSLLAIGLICSTAPAQNIIPVWEYLTNAPGGNPFFPFMKAEVNSSDDTNGTADMDFISSLVRYDEDRLLLFIIENGINETDENHDKQMAEQYPDRSIWWLNANDGSPIGIALEVGLAPFPDSDYYIQKTTGQHPDGPDTDRSWALTEIFPKMTVDADGYLYVTDKHKVLRYTPDGSGGFTGPEKVYEYPQKDPVIEGSSNLHYRAWRMWDIQVVGSGDNKVMTTDARFWIDNGGTVYYTSSDGGKTWEWVDEFNSGGGCSGPVTNADFGEEWVYNVAFPGRNGGKDDTPLRRYIRPIDSGMEFEEDKDFWMPEVDPSDVPDAEKYAGWAKVDVAAHQGVPYVTVYCMPRWQSRDSDDQPTAWLAVLDASGGASADGIDGDFVASYQIDFHEVDEYSPYGDPWNNIYLGEVNMYVGEDYPEGAFEILWAGGGIGYGRYVFGDVDVNVRNWPLF